MEGQEGGGPGSAGHLSCWDAGRRGAVAEKVWRKVGHEIPNDFVKLASELGESCCDLQISCGNTECHLHDERDRIAEQRYPQVKNRRIFPNDESALKLVWMTIAQAAKKWTMPIPNWQAALNFFYVQFGDRLPWVA